MDEKYDVIILGTGLKECILSGLLSVADKKVLHMDRNNYYGGECASLNLEALFKKFKGEDAKIPEILGNFRDYNVDLCPKFIMACGNLVKVLLHTKVTRYLEFRSINCSSVYKDGKVHKVPCTPKEALTTGLMGMFQKRRCKNFLTFVQDFDINHINESPVNVKTMTMRQIYDYFKLDKNTIAFIGHTLALYVDDSYMDDISETIPCIERCKLYAYSVSRYGNSPFIYSLQGLGGLPEGFSRLSAVYGGTYMLNRSIDKILYDDEGHVIGIESSGEKAYCKQLLGDPSYFLNSSSSHSTIDVDARVKCTGKVVRQLFILSHPIENTGTSLQMGDSCQIIIPATQVPNRKSDIYIIMLSHAHKVAAEGKYIAMISAKVETDDPRKELSVATRIIGQYDADFFFVSEMYTCVDPAKEKERGVFISSGYDATSHFETATEEVLQIYEQMTGKKIDLTISAEPEDVQSLE